MNDSVSRNEGLSNFKFNSMQLCLIKLVEPACHWIYQEHLLVGAMEAN